MFKMLCILLAIINNTFSKPLLQLHFVKSANVYVTQLMINKEVYIDTGGSTLAAKVVFLNFPSTKVVQRRQSVKDEKIYVYEFKRGQTIHFLMTPEELVKKLKRVPLKIGIFREDDNFPICQTQTFLRGCACDLGSLSIQKAMPFAFRGLFDLVDPGKSYAGQVELEITITSLGRSIITPFALAPNCFLFKNDPEEPEYKCNTKESTKTVPGSIIPYGDSSMNAGEFMIDKLLDTAPPGNLMKNVASISPAAERLALGSPLPKSPRPPLVDPTAISKKRGKKGKKGKRRKK